MGMTKHTASTARTTNIETLRASGTKTIKAACSKRIPTGTVVAIEESNCDACNRQIAADIAQYERTGRR